MRELQSTQAVLNKALSRAGDSKHIKSVYVVRGEISELDEQLIQKYWRELSTGTPAEQAQLYFRFIKAKVQCMACFSEDSPVDGKIHCPYCGSYGAKVLSGEEFYLESIEVEEN